MNKTKNNIVIVLLIGVAAFFFSGGKWNVAIMPWIWPACMVYFVRNTNGHKGLIITCILFEIVSIIKWYGCVGGYFIDNILAGLMIGAFSCLPVIIDHIFYGKIDGYKAAFLFPLAFASEEFILQLLPISMLGYLSSTQTGNDPLIQIASIFGSYGITFIVAWFGSTICYILEQYSADSQKAIRAGLAFILTFVVVLSFGGIRLAFADFSSPNIRVAVTTGPYTGDFMTDSFYTIPVESNIESMEKTVRDAAEGKADILEYCEEAFTVSYDEETIMLDAVRKAAKKNNIFVLIAFEIEDNNNTHDGMNENKEYLIDNNGEIVWKYNKTRLVAFVETSNITKGNGVIPNETVCLPSGKRIKIASAICMDSDYPTYIRTGIDNDTGLILIPTWDWAPIRAYHTKWVELRAVENGIALVRSCMDGVNTATDQYGRVIMHSDTAGSGYENVVFAEVPAKPVFTVYKTLGSLIDWCYFGGLLSLIIIGLSRKRFSVNTKVL